MISQAIYRDLGIYTPLLYMSLIGSLSWKADVMMQKRLIDGKKNDDGVMTWI